MLEFGQTGELNLLGILFANLLPFVIFILHLHGTCITSLSLRLTVSKVTAGHAGKQRKEAATSIQATTENAATGFQFTQKMLIYYQKKENVLSVSRESPVRFPTSGCV